MRQEEEDVKKTEKRAWRGGRKKSGREGRKGGREGRQGEWQGGKDGFHSVVFGLC